MQHRLRRSLGTIPGVCLACLLAFSLIGCSPAAPAPTAAPKTAPPTAAPAKPTAPAVSPTAAPAAAPTTAPAKKVDYPEKGRAINFIVAWPAGASADLSCRQFAASMEKSLGVPINVVNRPGGATQVGLTELVRAKPDGYTIGHVSLWMAVLSYLQPERQAVYTRADFAPVWMFRYVAAAWSVKADSPYKTLKDLVDAAKAKPGSIKLGDTGAMGDLYLAGLLFSKSVGATFVPVHFDGAAPALTALQGGHIDAAITMAGSAAAPAKSGQIRILGVMDKKRLPFIPDAPTFDELGHKGHYMMNYEAMIVPAGTPKEAVDVLGASVRKAQEDPEFVRKAEESGSVITKNMGPAEVAAAWTEIENTAKQSLELAKQAAPEK